MAKKHSFKKFGNEYRLLLIEEDGTKVYLEKHSWDCGWYWGMGYVETFTNNNRPEFSDDISSHSHFNYQFPDWQKFEKMNTTLQSPAKFWFKFKTAYTMKEFAEILHLRRDAYSLSIESVVYSLGESFSEESLNEKLKILLNEIWDMLA
jgi:hypothetical protein